MKENTSQNNNLITISNNALSINKINKMLIIPYK